jgi:hypothetical protein
VRITITCKHKKKTQQLFLFLFSFLDVVLSSSRFVGCHLIDRLDCESQPGFAISAGSWFRSATMGFNRGKRVDLSWWLVGFTGGRLKAMDKR